MKQSNLFLLLGICIFIAAGCAEVYTSTGDQPGIPLKSIAILPFDVKVQYKKLPRNVTLEQVHENELELAFVMQEQIYNRFLQRNKKIPVSFQDVDMTNMMLRRNNIDIARIGEFSKDELARLLEVDEIISGSMITTRPMSDGAAIALGVLLDFWGPTNQADVTVSLHSGIDSRLLWKFNDVYTGSVGSSPDQLTKAMMDPITRKFPYRKKRK